MSETTESTPAAQPTMPPFYKEPHPLEPVRHAKAGLAPRQDFSFAKATNAITLTVAEFSAAARSYPIVFTGAGGVVVPFAVVGLNDGENLFLDESGRWREEAYVPAYVRRYPFIFSSVPNSQQLVLCVDEAADNFQRESQQPFFVDGKPSEALQRVLSFGEAFQQHYADTLLFGQWLDQNGLLEEQVARVQLNDKEVFTLRGFRLLKREKLRELTDAQVLDLHKKGWLGLMHFQIQSLDNFAALSRLMRARRAGANGGSSSTG